MTKQTITTEIDIPDGYEFVRIDADKGACNHTPPCKRLHAEVIIRPVWQPPSWMRPGWIVKTTHGDMWWWSETEPYLSGTPTSHWSTEGDCCLIYRDGFPTVADFTPPPCDDARKSKRRIGGAECAT